MEEPKYTIDLRTNNGWWAKLQSRFVGGRLVTPNQGSQTGPVSAHGHRAIHQLTMNAYCKFLRYGAV